MISDSHLRIKVRHAVCQYVEYFVKEFQLGKIKPNLPKLLYIGFKLIPQIPYKIGV